MTCQDHCPWRQKAYHGEMEWRCKRYIDKLDKKVRIGVSYQSQWENWASTEVKWRAGKAGTAKEGEEVSNNSGEGLKRRHQEELGLRQQCRQGNKRSWDAFWRCWWKEERIKEENVYMKQRGQAERAWEGIGQKKNWLQEHTRAGRSRGEELEEIRLELDG